LNDPLKQKQKQKQKNLLVYQTETLKINLPISQDCCSADRRAPGSLQLIREPSFSSNSSRWLASSDPCLKLCELLAKQSEQQHPEGGSPEAHGHLERELLEWQIVAGRKQYTYYFKEHFIKQQGTGGPRYSRTFYPRFRLLATRYYTIFKEPITIFMSYHCTCYSRYLYLRNVSPRIRRETSMAQTFFS